MIIRFKLGEFDEMYDKYEKLFEAADSPVLDERENDFVVFCSPFRIVIPQFKASFREGDYYERREEYTGENSSCGSLDFDEEFCYEDTVIIRYLQNQTDIREYLTFTAKSIDYAIYGLCEKEGFPFDNRDDLDCYIDTSEFIDEERVNELFLPQ